MLVYKLSFLEYNNKEQGGSSIMLLQFNFKNFKSFRDETTLDLTATKITEFSNHVVSIANEKVLPVAAIFGANASGKSNVQDAFKFMSSYVIKSFGFGGDDTSKKASDNLKRTPFLFDTVSRAAESSFEIFFMDTKENVGVTYNYGFSINNNGISEEWLNYRTKTQRGAFKKVFYRKGTEFDLSGLPAKSQNNILVALEKETLIVSLGAKLKISKLKYIRDWFVNNEIVNFGQPVENYFLSKTMPNNFDVDKEVQNSVIRYFSSFDPSIIGFKVEKLPESDEDKEPGFKIDAIHKMIDSDETAMIPLTNESAGTLKMFAMYPFLQSVFAVGGVLFVDELNARLHPLLVRTIIISFLNKEINTNHAQLIFTSHDTWQMNANILRRDEIWFTDKDGNGVSTLYSLADFVDEDGTKIRKDENYEKNYLLGKYGAIPSMNCFDMFKQRN